MSIRIGKTGIKTGMKLELAAMADISRTIEQLPSEMRQRVANWVSAQPWQLEQPATPVEDPKQTTLPSVAVAAGAK